MRRPKGKLSERQRIEMVLDELASEGIVKRKQRKAVPPDSWDGLQISYTRGQPWQRVVKSKWQK